MNQRSLHSLTDLLTTVNKNLKELLYIKEIKQHTELEKS